MSYLKSRGWQNRDTSRTCIFVGERSYVAIEIDESTSSWIEQVGANGRVVDIASAVKAQDAAIQRLISIRDRKQAAESSSTDSAKE
jgi:hypothetical protein